MNPTFSFFLLTLREAIRIGNGVSPWHFEYLGVSVLLGRVRSGTNEGE
jgi:hypothetical protein